MLILLLSNFKNNPSIKNYKKMLFKIQNYQQKASLTLCKQRNNSLDKYFWQNVFKNKIFNKNKKIKNLNPLILRYFKIKILEALLKKIKNQ